MPKQSVPRILDHQQISSFIVYDPITGKFYRLLNGIFKGEAGYIDNTHPEHPYVRIDFLGKGYRASRLAYFLVTREWPEDCMDHVNGDTLDNRWVNLRPATKAQNNCNRKKNRNNTSGIGGVYFAQHSWKAEVRFKKKRYTKRFKIKEDAEAWRKQKAQELFQEFCNEKDR